MKSTAAPAALAVWLAAGIAAAQMLPRQPPATVPRQGTPTASPPAAPPPAYLTRQTDLEIPFTVRPGSTPEQQPAAVRIFVSWDRGATWHFYDQRRAEEGRFRFRPRQDGEFWFTTQTLDARGQPDSPQPRAAQLRLIVDTQRPQLLVQAQVDGSGNVQLAYTAADAHLVATSLKIEYQDATGNGGPWQPVELPPPPADATTTLTGQKTFHPTVASTWINLRAEVADAAGNVAYSSQRLSLRPPVTAGPSASPPPDPSATPWVSNVPLPATDAPPPPAVASMQPAGSSAPPATGQSGPAPLASDPAAGGPGPGGTTPSGVVTNPYVGPGRLASTASSTTDLRPAAEPLPAAGTGSSPPAETLPLPPAADSSPEVFIPQSVPSNEPQPRPPTSDTPQYGRIVEQKPELGPQDSLPSPMTPTQEGTLPPPAYARPLPPRDDGQPGGPQFLPPNPVPTPSSEEEPLPPSQPQQPRLTNSRRFRLEYDVETVGPEGLAAVELWGTSDGGKTWLKWGRDPDLTSPLEVEVGQEGVYGFRIVVVGKHGLATSAPQPGDAADIWVGVDLTRPTAKLLRAAYGEGAMAGKLDIRWQADDAHLGSRPITLLVGERPDGPFTVIAAGLPNTGQYWWDPQPRLPRQLFLRLEVRDEAGNVAIDQLTEPIRVEGLEPKGRIRGLSPADLPLRGAAAGSASSR